MTKYLARIAVVVFTGLFGAGVGLGVAVVGGAAAQSGHGKLIKLIVPATAGSPLDVVARVLSQRMSVTPGQNVIVDNRPGAGTTLGSKAVAAADPDGNTLLFTSVSHVVSAAMYKSLDYHPIKDFAPVATVANSSWVLVITPSVPAKSVQELIAYAKANPGKLNFGFGYGTAPHLVGELFKLTTGTNIVTVPYKGGAPAVTDILSGQIHMNFGTTATVLPLIRDGRLRALAVTSEARHPELPDVPTMVESGLPNMTLGFWLGVLAPANTPAGIVEKLNAEISGQVRSSEMITALAKLGFDPKVGSPQDFARFVAADAQTWADIVKRAGVQTN